ncbi:MAG: SIMPL domain-containing protein [Anaerolineae bacterium]|nr:SIMPL domain-containing protein [Anaerolineae bacterium]MCX8066489.1 SIMPL domain-containing protein [Anaerolineae bacterium]MDW7990885.1 SIMPL domain-containing protein [Anaerolineae bacterium]
MTKKVQIAYPVLAVLLALFLLAGCGARSVVPTLAGGEGSPLRGGGGGVYVSSAGTITQGLVATGSATVSAEPEIARVTFGVDLRGADPAAIVREAAEKMNRALAAVKALGVAEADIQTTGYNLWVESVYDPETGRPTGEIVYHVSHFVQVTLRDMGRVGDLLAAVVEAGANSISGVEFTVENPDALVQEARKQALENARAQAQQMAGVLGVTLGKPVLVTEGGAYPVAVPVMAEGRGGGGPTITPGAFSVTVSVQVVYEIR